MEVPQRNVLITGASGFIGQALCAESSSESWAIRALVRTEESREKLPQACQDNAVIGDLSDSGSLLAACEGVDTILHLAGQAHVKGAHDPAVVPTQIAAAENLLSAALKQGVRRLVFVSSSLAAAAERKSGDVTSYGQGKLAAEAVFTAACEEGGIELAILRPVNVYGVGMKGNIAGMISMINSGRLPPLPLISSRLSLIGVTDLSRAIILAANSPDASGKSYTVTDGEVYKISDIEAAIYRALGKTTPRLRMPAVILYVASALAGLLNATGLRKGSISTRTYRNLMNDNLFESKGIRQELGFGPENTLYDVLPDIIDSIKRSSKKT